MSPEFKFRALTSEDWKEGIEGNRTYDKLLSLNDTENNCTYTSELLDSGIPNCSWYRIVLDADIPENSSITVSFVTSETKEVKTSTDSVKIVFKKVEDALFQVPPGRYIQLQIDLHRNGKETPVLRQVKVYYHRLSYTSELLDSGISGCCWHRMVLDADIPENSTITVSFITSETEEAKIPSSEEGIIFTKAKDALIQAPPGRYIRLKIDFHREGKEAPVLRQVKVYYERLSYLRYLPAIYQENNESKKFLERFLSIFESSMYDSEEMISNIPMFFDPMAAPEDFYRWLADWMSLDLYDQLDEKTMREYILNAVKFYKKKGTISGLRELVTFLTENKKCCIKEYRNNIFRSWGMEHKDVTASKDQVSKCKEYEKSSEHKCAEFYHNTSRTLDTKNPVLLNNMGKNKYCDEVHYTLDTSNGGTYSPNVIGIFIFIQEKDRFVIDTKEYENQLYRIIDSFLPVFVRPRIYLVPVSYIETYDKNKIVEKYSDFIHTYIDEIPISVFGCYEDATPDRTWIYSFGDGHIEKKITNNAKYRTFHSGIGHENQL